MRRYEPKPWDIRRCDMIHADEGEYVLYCDAQTEIERLTKARDEALLAQVAAAYELAAQAKVFMAEEGGFLTRVPLLPETKAAIRSLTPADAKAALEAYGREKVEQALDAANAYMTIQYGIAALGHPVDRQRILAEMEKLK